MNPIVTCDCGEVFECETRFVGGYVNCPRCRRAVQVPGLRDPLWRVVQVAAFLGWLGLITLGYHLYAVQGAILFAVLGVLGLWGLSRAM